MDHDNEDDNDGENFDYYNFGNNSNISRIDYDEEATGVFSGSGIGSNGGREGEWSDPWPTNDDWRRFRRRFQRAVRQSLEVMERNRLAYLQAQAAAAAAAELEEQQHFGKSGKTCSSGRGKGSGKGTGKIMTTSKRPADKNGGRASREAERERDPLLRAGLGRGGGGRIGKHVTENKRIRVPAIKGASLLWRYTRGGYV